MYEKSYMHRDTVTHVVVRLFFCVCVVCLACVWCLVTALFRISFAWRPTTQQQHTCNAKKVTPNDFIITGSADGHLKFWKRTPNEPGVVEFVKHYRSHLGAVDALAASADGALCASASRDRTVKVYDVASFDMIVMLRVPFTPGCIEWISKRGDARWKLAISDLDSPSVAVYDARSGDDAPIATLDRLHAAPVTVMRYSAATDIAISSDAKGFVFVCVFVLVVSLFLSVSLSGFSLIAIAT